MYILNLSLGNDYLSNTLSCLNNCKIQPLKNPIFEKIYKLSYPNPTKNSFNKTDIIICNTFTFKNAEFFNDFYCTSSYIIFPEIFRFIGNLKPKLFIILDKTEYTNSRHYEEFKILVTSLSYTIIENSVTIDNVNYSLILGIKPCYIPNNFVFHSKNTKELLEKFISFII